MNENIIFQNSCLFHTHAYAHTHTHTHTHTHIMYTHTRIHIHTRTHTHTHTQWLYVVGSTNDGTSCRLLKIDRTFPSPSHPQLEVDEGDVEYTEGEIKDLLIMLDDGNKYSANKYRTHGLKQVASAFGIIGMFCQEHMNHPSRRS